MEQSMRLLHFVFSMEKLLEKKALLKKLRCYRAYFGQNLFYDAAQDKLLWAVASKFARNRQDCSCWFHFSNAFDLAVR